MSVAERTHADQRRTRVGASVSRTEDDRLTPRLRVSEVQRSRLLNAAVQAVDQMGYAEVSVTEITNRARVSRRTFYDLFDSREDCLTKLLDDTLVRIRAELSTAIAPGLPWREKVRVGLETILAFFDRDPVLARACVVQCARGDEQLLERRAAIFAELAAVLEEGRGQRTGVSEPPPLMAEGLVGAAHSIIHERLLRRSPQPFTALVPQLMGMIVLPYLGSAAARREQERAPSTSQPSPGDHATGAQAGEVLRSIPMRLTYRTIRVLQAISANPGASNRPIGAAADISDQGQISRLLGRLQRFGLIDNDNDGHTRGDRNAWRLTETGERVARGIVVRHEDRTSRA